MCRSANQIKTLLNELQNKIREVEHQFGSSVDNLRQQLQEKEEKYGENIEFVSRLKESCEVNEFIHITRNSLNVVQCSLSTYHIHIHCRNILKG